LTDLKYKLVLFDVDGVLTDGKLWYSDKGESLKPFHAWDGLGMQMLQSCGFLTGILSARSSSAFEQRAKDIKPDIILTGTRDKSAGLDHICDKLGLKPKDVVFMGDDVLDLPVFKRAGLAVCPANAHPIARKYAHWVLERNGGEGAARELADRLIVEAGFELESVYERFIAIEKIQELTEE
jgi:3-deoxy-D-manno-octulosonate 8-phosphate phosphatase (KDO 8-P phosphatase)